MCAFVSGPFVPLPGSVMTMFRGKACLQVMQVGWVICSNTNAHLEQTDRGLGFAFLAAPTLAQGLVAQPMEQDVGSVCPSSTEIF